MRLKRAMQICSSSTNKRSQYKEKNVVQVLVGNKSKQSDKGTVPLVVAIMIGISSAHLTWLQ